MFDSFNKLGMAMDDATQATDEFVAELNLLSLRYHPLLWFFMLLFSKFRGKNGNERLL